MAAGRRRKAESNGAAMKGRGVAKEERISLEVGAVRAELRDAVAALRVQLANIDREFDEERREARGE